MQPIKAVWIGLLFIVVLLGCKEIAVESKVKVDNVHTLKTSLEVLTQKEKYIELRLVFENISDKPLRIFYMDHTLFSRVQNSFYFIDSRGKKYFEMEDVPPHGFLVHAQDFYLIAPYEKKSFIVKMTLPTKEMKKIYWRYHNKLTSWKGDFETLDGKSRALFNGHEIPYIWVGSIENSIKI